MKRIVLSVAAVIIFSGYCFAQSGNNQVGVGGSADFLLSPGYRAAYKDGFGGNIKALYGLGDWAQVTLTVAYSSFNGKSGTLFYTNQNLSLLPVLAGYRYNLPEHLYVEGQAGIGFLTQHSPGYTYTQTNPAAGFSAGVIMDGFDLSALIYTEGSVMNQFAIKLAYNFSFK
jgi:hypothetical protein